jgi:hypothetical protein
MPRDGAIIFSDLIGKLDVLRVFSPACQSCAATAARLEENSLWNDQCLSQS